LRRALLVVDVQRDFCKGGALAVIGADEVVPKLNAVIDLFTRASIPIFFTRDWHPSNHMSFKTRGGPWPPHCIQGSQGAAFHPGLRVPPGAVVIDKGTEPDYEAYSGFQGTDLKDRLKGDSVDEILIGGLTTDYCVRETTLDGLGYGLSVSVLEDCVRGVNLNAGDAVKALREIAAKGARLVQSSLVLASYDALRRGRKLDDGVPAQSRTKTG